MNKNFAIQTWLLATQQTGFFTVNEVSCSLTFIPEECAWYIWADCLSINIEDDGGFVLWERGKGNRKIETLSHMLKMLSEKVTDTDE